MSENPAPYMHPDYLEEVGKAYPTAYALILWQTEEIDRLNTIIHQLAADGMQACAAMRELLSGHDNLYRAHWGHLPTCDPTDDIAAKAARAFLDEYEAVGLPRCLTEHRRQPQTSRSGGRS